MDNRAYTKTKISSRHVTERTSRAPHRSYLYARNLYAKEIFEAGTVSLLMRTPLDHGLPRTGCLTVTGRTVNENLSKVVWNDNQDVIWPAGKPITVTGGVGFLGSLRTEGAIAKVRACWNRN